MGSATSKFKRHLLAGDEYAALQIFQNTPELGRSLDPNSSYGDSLHHNTPLHLAAKHAMKPLLRVFLKFLGGNPNKRNANNQTALHLACQDALYTSESLQLRRADCVVLILQWRGPDLGNNEGEEAIDLSATDEYGNTALHYAAESGLKKCVELLIQHGAPLFHENQDQDTACDLAEKKGFEDIAQYLESKMVFSPDANEGISESDLITYESQEECNGLRPQDLQEAKDQLLVETSDMLHVPLFPAEALLRSHEWSREVLLEAWVKDPIACCQKAGIQPPTSALQYFTPKNGLGLRVTYEQVHEEYQNESLNSPARSIPLETEILCEICATYIPVNDEPVAVPCEHQFCRKCWQEYLTVKIQEGNAYNVMCPAFDCPHLVPSDIIERLVSPNMVRKFLQFDIEAFVESNPHIKWCPSPGCDQAVRLPDLDPPKERPINIPNAAPLAPLSHAVDCGRGHYFCWECLGEAHSPCGCEKWEEWRKRISQVKPDELRHTYVKTEDAANCLWLVTNSKPCPSCKSPIQKNEGCNHMKCSKCKHDFCWVCMEPWKKHSSATGGYFRCNRSDAVQRAEQHTGILINEAETHNKQMQELKRFVQHYTCFKNHESSYKEEEPLLKVVQEKREIFAASVEDPVTADYETQFLEEAVLELLRARRILLGACVYGYYLEDNGYNKTIFDFMQNDLEEATQKLSKMIARHHLRTPRAKIIQATVCVKRKRQEFLMAVSKGLIPPETPPNLRRIRRRRYPGLMGMDPVDDQLSQAIVASLQDLDPENPWVKDSHGRHANLAAIYDWPDYDSDEDSSSALTATLLGVCLRKTCNRPRARNPRTGGIHKYCSLFCKQQDVSNEEGMKSANDDSTYSTDLLLALEMSRLQMIEDTKRRQMESEEEQALSIPPKENNNEVSTSESLPLSFSVHCETTDQQNNLPEVSTAHSPSSDNADGFEKATMEPLQSLLMSPSTSVLSSEKSISITFPLESCSAEKFEEDKSINQLDLCIKPSNAPMEITFFLKGPSEDIFAPRNYNMDVTEGDSKSKKTLFNSVTEQESNSSSEQRTCTVSVVDSSDSENADNTG